MNTVNGILNGLRIFSKGVIAEVVIQPIENGIELSAPSSSYQWKTFSAAEERLFQVVDAISIFYHVPQALGVNRKWFPVAESDETRVRSAPVDLAMVANAHQELSNSSNGRILRAVLRVVQRADQCEDWSDKLLLLWMAFNTLYSTSRHRAERMKIATFMVDQHFTDEELQPWVVTWIESGGFDDLYKSKLTLPKWNKIVIPVGDELAEAARVVISTQAGYIAFMSKLLLTVCALRNQFFDGTEPVISSEAANAVEIGARSLDFVVRSTIQKLLGLPVAGPVSKVVGSLNEKQRQQ